MGKYLLVKGLGGPHSLYGEGDEEKKIFLRLLESRGDSPGVHPVA
jgi:hypothetical protein